MDGGAGDLHAPLQRRLMDPQPIESLPAEGGDQGGVDVDDPVRPPPDEVRGQNGQEPGQNDQVHLILRQLSRQRRLEPGGAQLLPGHGKGGDAPAPGPLQGKGVRIAGEDQHNLPVGEGPCRLGVEQRLQIGAAAGDQHGDAGLVQHSTTRSSPGTISPIT